jgi:hypothetical protein
MSKENQYHLTASKVTTVDNEKHSVNKFFKLQSINLKIILN